MAAPNATPPEPRRFSIRLPRPLWIGVAIRLLSLLLLFAAGCGKARNNASEEAILAASEPSKTVPDQPDLSRLLKKGMTQHEVIAILEVTAVSAGPFLTAHVKNVRYRTRRFPRHVVDVEYARSPTATTLASWKFADEEDYDDFVPVEDSSGEAEGGNKLAWSDDSTELAEQIKYVLASDNTAVGLRGHVSEGYTRLFESVGVGDGRPLQLHDCDSIALQAAWQEVVLEIPLEDFKTWRPGRTKLAWFLGILEGRARVKAPAWWSEMLLNSGSFRRGDVFPGEPDNPPTRASGLTAVRVPRGTTVRKEANSVTVQVGGDSIAFPANLLELPGGVDALKTSDRVYVAAYNAIGAPFPIVCFDSASGAVIWKKGVWASLTEGTSGGYEMTVSLIEQEGHVMVFGGGTTGLFVESFRARDGENLFRFSTSLRIGDP